MGEAGSLAASPGPGNQPQPSDAETHGPGLLCLPMEMLLLILEKLPRRSLPNVRLVCRKLESVSEAAIERLFICVEAQPRSPETHPIFRPGRQRCAQATAYSHATACEGRPQLALNGGPSATMASANPPVAPQPPGWARYVQEVHLSLRTDPQPEPQPQLARRQTDVFGYGGSGGGVHPDDLDMLAAGAPAAGVGAAAGGQELLQQAQALMAAVGLQPVALPLPPPLWQDAAAVAGEVPVALLEHLLPPPQLQQPQQPVGPAAAGAAALPDDGQQQPPGAAAAVVEPHAGTGAAQGGGAGHQAPAATAAVAIAGLMQQAHAAHQPQPQGQQEQPQPLQNQQQGREAAAAAAAQGAADTAGAASSADGAVGQDRNAPASGANAAGDSPSWVPAARAALTPAQAEAVLNARLGALAHNLMPYLRSLRVLSLYQLPRGCMAAAGDLLAAASALTELRVVRVDPPEVAEPPPPPPPPEAAAAAAAGGVLLGLGGGVAPDELLQYHAALQNQLNVNHELQQVWHGIVAAMQGDGQGGVGGGGAAAAAAGQAAYLGLGLEPEPQAEPFEGADDLQMEDLYGGGDGDGGDGVAMAGGDGPGVQGLEGAVLGRDNDRVGSPTRGELGGNDGDSEPGRAAAGLEAAAAASIPAAPVSSGDPRIRRGPWKQPRSPGRAMEEQDVQDEDQEAGEERGGEEEEEEGRGWSFERGYELSRLLGQAAAAAAAAPEAAIGDAADAAVQEQRMRSWRQGEAGSCQARGVTAAAAAASADPAGPGSSSGPGPSGGVKAAVAADIFGTSGGAVGGGSGGGEVSAAAAADAGAAAVGPSASGTLPAPNGGEDAGEEDAATSAPDVIDCGTKGGDSRGGGTGGGGGRGAATAPDATSADAGADGDRAFWSRMASLPGLRALVLRGGALAGADMEGLMALTGLQQLEVNHVVNTHPGLACVASLSGLTRLVIEDLQYVGGAIHDEFCGLSRLTGLRSLSFLVVGPLPAEVMAWGSLTQLTQLEITNHYDDNLLPCFSTVLPRLPHLRVLNLSNFDINNSLLIALRPCSHLSSLHMGRFNLTNPCTEVMPAVRQLHLGFVDDLQHTELPLVAVFPSLEELALQTRYVLSHDSAQRIPRELLPSGPGQRPLPVARLHLYDALMNKQVPLAVPSVTRLRLDWNQTDTDLLVSYMSEWGGSLSRLSWVHCDAMRDEGLAALAVGLPRLEELELVRCVSVTDGGLVALAALTQLTSLTVAEAHQLTAAGFMPVVSALPLLERLTLRDLPALAPEAATELERCGHRRRRGQLLVELLP